MNVVGATQIGDLPDLPLSCIFRFLDLQSRKNASRVCGRWMTVAEVFRILVHSPVKLSDYSLGSVCKTELPRTQLQVRGLQSVFSVSSRRNGWIAEVVDLTFAGLPSSESNVQKILTNARELRSLKFEPGTMIEFKQAPRKLEFPHLRSLIFETFTNGDASIPGMRSLFKNGNFPLLESLRIQFFGEESQPKNAVSTPAFLTLYEALYEFLGRHSGTLRDLVMDKVVELRAGTGNAPCFDQVTRDGLRALNLSSLKLYTGFYETDFWTLDPLLSVGSTRLQSLHLTGQPIFQAFETTLERNLGTLRDLTWISGDVSEAGVSLKGVIQTNFDMRLVAGSTMLRNLLVHSTTLTNFLSVPLGLTHLEFQCSLSPNEVTWIAQNLEALQYFGYRRNSLHHAFVPITLGLLQVILQNLSRLRKAHLFCRENVEPIKDFVRNWPGDELGLGPQEAFDEVVIFISH